MLTENNITINPAQLHERQDASGDLTLHPKVHVVRIVRDVLIAETDVWALSDRTMTAEQTAYRQALRDITNQDGFPTNITWPTKP